MDFSSDDSFAWTNASHVSEAPDSDSMTDTKELNGHSVKTPKEKNSKAKEETTVETNKTKKRKINQNIETDSEDYQSPKKKKIKTEIASDESSKKKSKHRIVFEKSDEENYLDMKIKSEELSTPETSFSKPKKKKRKKHNDSETLNESENADDTYLNVCATQEVTTELNNTSKVKKVKKKKKDEESFVANGCVELDEPYLNIKVKEEPDLSDSTVKTKKKKKSKLSICSNLDDEQNVEESYLNIRVKEEENSFAKQSKKKKHSIGSNENQPGSDVDNSTNNQIPDEVASNLLENSPISRKSRKSEISKTEVDEETVKKSKKSKTDKRSQMELECFQNNHEVSLSNHVSKSNESKNLENPKANKQQTPVKPNQKKKNHSTSSHSDEDMRHKEHIFKTPQVSSKLLDKKNNSINTNDKSPAVDKSTSLGNKFQITKSNRISDRNMSYDSSDEVSATNMSISPITNQTISNRKHSLGGDSSDDDIKAKNRSSKLVPKSPEFKKESSKNITKRTVSRGDYSDEDKEKSPAHVLKSPQAKKQSSKTIPGRTISRESSSGSSSDEANQKTPKPISKPQSERTVSKSNHTSDDETSNEGCKSPSPVKKSPTKKQSNYNVSRRTISESSEEDSSVENNRSVVKSPSKNAVNNVSKKTVSDSSEEDNLAENRIKSVTKSPKRQPTSKRTVSKRDDSSDKETTKNKPEAQPKAVAKRRITDRILFEQDDSDAEHDISTSRLQQFLKTNTNLHTIVQKPTSNSVITDDDEIWILKCPSDINVKNLKDSEFLLDKKCKFKMNGETYLGCIDNNIEKVSVTSFEQDKCLIKNVPVNGVVHIKKRVPKQHFYDDSMLMQNQNHFIPLPETKCRHPLFGSNFKKAIKVPKHIVQRLKDSEETKEDEEISPKEERRQRKKLKKRLRESLKEEPMEVVPEQEVLEVKKKAKKRKHEDAEEPPKKKKKKHNESSEVWDSAQAIEESLFNY